MIVLRFSHFSQFLNEVKTQHSTMIKTFRSDNAMEYMSSSFKSLMKANSIIHEISCSQTLQQNGVSKKKHCHLLEVIRSLMFKMNVLKNFLSKALLTACYLINRMRSVLTYASPLFGLYPWQTLV